MAEVFLAKSFGAEGLEKRLVLKRILPDYAKRPKFVSMFIDEAKLAVSLNHPNIAQVYEFGKVRSSYYLAMEYVDGTDLGRVISAAKKSGEPLEFGDVAFIGIEVAKALDYAHRKIDEYGRKLAIVHRDVSPQNILLRWDGSVKLVDFGIAKARTTAVEKTGVVKGKISYMAPEQALGGTVDARTDLFSLGAVLYEMVAGRAPFPRGKPEEVLPMVRAGIVPDLSNFRSDVPIELHTIIMKAVQRAPEDRWQSARELQVALTKYQFSLEDIHDAATVSDRLTALRATIERPEPVTRPAEPKDTMISPTSRPDTMPEPSIKTSELQTGDTQNRYMRGTDTGATSPFGRTHFREHRETFVIASELMGMSDLRNEVTEDRWRQVLLDYIHLVQSVGFKNHCGVDRVDERGFVLLAGVPFSSESDAETAVRVGFDLIEAVEAMNINLKSQLHLGVGIAAGSLVLEHTGEGSEGRFSWIAEGDSWEAARLLASSAMAAEVLIDEATFKRTRRTYRHKVLRERELSQIGGGYRVEGAKSHRERLLERRKSFTTLHGRDFELRLLRQAFQTAKRIRTTQTVVLLGEAGVGKASIVEEFVSGLAPDRVRVVRASCSPDTKDRPFAPIIEMLEDFFQIEDTSDLRAVKSQIEDQIGSLTKNYDEPEQRYILHAVALLFNVKYPNNVIESLDAGRRRSRLFLSLIRLLGATASKGAAVIIINDIQWADQSSLEFLVEVVRQPRKRSILLTLTGKSTELRGRELLEILNDVPGAVVHNVADLPPHATRALIRDLFDLPLAPALVEQIVDRSGGNPLFIKEISEHLQEVERALVVSDGILVLPPGKDDLDLPVSVESIVSGRINALPMGPKYVLQKAAVIGRNFQIAELDAVLGEIPQVELDDLVARGFFSLVEEAGRDSYYRFRKGLTRKLALRTLLEEERAESHARLAEYLISKDLELIGAELSAVAKHLEAAGDLEDAGQYYLLAAEHAKTNAGLVEAYAHVGRALKLLDQESAFLFTALDLKERLLKDLGRNDERRATLDQLRAYVETAGLPELSVTVLNRLARYEFDQGHLDQAEVAVRSALMEGNEIGDSLGVAEALTLLASVLRNTGRVREAREACEESLELYEENPNLEGQAAAWNQLGILEHQAGHLDEALDAYHNAVD